MDRKGTSRQTQHAAFVLLMIGVGIVLGIVIGCSTPPPAKPTATQDALRGMTKQAILACAGAPLKETTRDGLTVLTYHRDAPILEESFMGSKSSVPQKHHGCSAYVHLKEDRVDGVRYRSDPPSFGGEDHCDAIFQSCGQH